MKIVPELVEHWSYYRRKAAQSMRNYRKMPSDHYSYVDYLKYREYADGLLFGAYMMGDLLKYELTELLRAWKDAAKKMKS